MGVVIRNNDRYRELVHNLVQKNIQSEDKTNGHIKGIFSILAKWRDRSGFEESEIELKRRFAMAHHSTRCRREIEAIWMRRLLTMPRPKYMN